jgi:flavin reductase (DIM6/NTAB) family NADH-FMN oxidoreductase RutF
MKASSEQASIGGQEMKQEDISKVIGFVRDPAKVTMAIVKDVEQDKFNAITLEWFMRTSIEPPMFAISIGHTRYSYKCLQNHRYFNLCFPSPELVKETIICGSKSGRDIDKFELENLDYFAGKLAKLPIIRKAAATFECKIISQVRSGDHTIYAGEVKYAWYNPDKRVITYTDLQG